MGDRQWAIGEKNMLITHSLSPLAYYHIFL